jgi:uncharacterized membrane protein
MMLVYFSANLLSSNHDVVMPMEKERGKFGVSIKLTLATVFAALVFVVTSQIPPIPIPATGGYFNLGETTIYVAALLFGPFVGAFSGGVGASLADVYLGTYVHFAPGTLIIKGVEGTIVGFLNIKLKNRIPNSTVRAIISIIPGGIAMVVGYFLYETLLATLLPSLDIYAMGEIPLNIGQMLVSLIIAVPTMQALLRIFPQLKSQI